MTKPKDEDDSLLGRYRLATVQQQQMLHSYEITPPWFRYMVSFGLGFALAICLNLGLRHP